MSNVQLVEFAPAENRSERKKFIDLQWKLYEGDKAWVPPLRLTIEDNLDTKKNPFYKHARIRLWNAYRDGKHVGRIAAVVDDRHNEFHAEKTGFWGFFESIDDQEVANTLFTAAAAWVKQQGMTNFRGPANPSFNHEVGIQLNNFERAPYIMMTYTKSYYPQLVEAAGFQKVKDLYAYEMPAHYFNEKVEKIANMVLQKSAVKFRQINMKKFNEEVEHLLGVYNDAWEKNWGFVPMDADEFRHMAKGMKDIIWPEFCLMAENAKGEVVGFSLALPDINQLLTEIPSGRLLPFGIFKLLTGIGPKKKKINRVRVITLGVKKSYRGTGVASVFYLQSFRVAKELGVWGGECSWILEDNKEMNSAIQQFANLQPYKTYRIYEKTI